MELTAPVFSPVTEYRRTLPIKENSICKYLPGSSVELFPECRQKESIMDPVLRGAHLGDRQEECRCPYMDKLAR